MEQLKKKIHYWCPDTIQGFVGGKEIVTAVFDTGVVVHPDLRGKICGWKDCINHKPHVYDDNGHGTHVAGILAGNGVCSKGKYSGIAPYSKIVCIKVLDFAGNGKVKNIIEGIRFVLEKQHVWQIRIANISMGTMVHEGNEEEAELLKWVEKMWDAGIVVITASGNSGPDYGSVTLPGISKKVITVGACDAMHDKYRPNPNYYSGCGPTKDCVKKPDVCAPGNGIYSCNSRYPGRSKFPYIPKSGTSMATPVISGATALLLEKYPDMGNVEVKMHLWESVDDMGFEDNLQGRGRINITKFLS